MTGPQETPAAEQDEDVPAENRFELLFEASGVVGKGAADSTPAQHSESEQQ